MTDKCTPPKSSLTICKHQQYAYPYYKDDPFQLQDLYIEKKNSCVGIPPNPPCNSLLPVVTIHNRHTQTYVIVLI